jgi:hypothetical protein
MDWQPIETAPKDKEVLLFFPPIDNPMRGRTHNAWMKIGYV